MTTNAILEEHQTFKVIGFYSLRSEEKELSETDDFFQRMQAIPEIIDQLERLAYWLNVIGDGKLPFCDSFREEGICMALPPSVIMTRETIDLRLYLYAKTDQVIILFNGGLKTKGARTAQECPNVAPHFRRATYWTKQLQKEDFEISFNRIVNLNEICISY